MEQILFYRTGEDFGEFSNFAAFPITIDGKVFPTTEHYFQSQKFLDLENQEAIRQEPSPMKAALMGRELHRPLRSDWDLVKDDVMYTALVAKFSQHPQLKERLLSTGSAELVEHTKNDSYWADGGDGSGLNRLGILLMKLRAELTK